MGNSYLNNKGIKNPQINTAGNRELEKPSKPDNKFTGEQSKWIIPCEEGDHF